MNPDTLNRILADGKMVNTIPKHKNEQYKRHEIYVKLDTLHIAKEHTTDKKHQRY